MKKDRPQILITGKSGQVGFELERCLAPLGNIVAVDIPECDLRNPEEIRTLVKNVRPNLIVNPAAYTAVDDAESDMETARAINTVAPGVLAQEAWNVGAKLIHYSTDYVFDGESKKPYLEEDLPNPKTIYGRTKLDGETAIRNSKADYIILRLAWVYGTRGKNFLLTMIRLAKEKDTISVVNDQFGTPSWSRLIAIKTSLIANRMLAEVSEYRKTYHLPSSGETSWFDYSRKALGLALDCGVITRVPEILPVSSAEYKTKAKRPKYSILDDSKIRRDFQVFAEPWEDALRQCIEEISESTRLQISGDQRS